MYDERCTTLGMLVSSSPPHDAGLQRPLAELLVERGAALDVAGSKWNAAVHGALVAHRRHFLFDGTLQVVVEERIVVESRIADRQVVGRAPVVGHVVGEVDAALDVRADCDGGASGDCHGGNVLWTDDGPHFVDFDDALMAPAIQDLWMLLSGERPSMEAQLAIVLEAYETFRDFDRRELALIEPLRTLRLLHYSAWLARRIDDPAFPAAFPWFNTQRYWQDRILELREQIALMNEPPLQA